MLQGDGGVEKLMQQPVYQNQYGVYSQAELLADVINIMRMDVKRVADVHGVDISIRKIQPEKVAWALAEMVEGNTEPMVSIFNEIEDYHHEVLAEALGDEEFETYLDFKEEQLFTVEPGEELSEDELEERLDEVADELEDDLGDHAGETDDTPDMATAGGDDE